MPSADLYGALQTFLDGDAGDVVATVNAEQPSFFVTGKTPASVGWSRDERGGDRKPRRDPTVPTSAEIVPVELAANPREVGIGFYEKDAVVEIHIVARLKDTSAGKALIDKVAKAARALAYRYNAVSNLVIPVTIGTASFKYSSAFVKRLDAIPQSTEYARAEVRAAFTFLEEGALNS